MATPEQHPTWIEAILGSGFLAVVLPKCIDWMRGSLILRRKEDATVVIAKIEDEAKWRAELMARISQLEAQNAAKDNRLAHLEASQDLITKQLAAMLDRSEKFVGTSEIADLQAAFKQIIFDLRTILGRDQSPIATGPRKLGDPPLIRESGE